MIFWVNFTKPSVVAQFLINRVTITIGANGYAKYVCDLGIYNMDLLDLLIVVARRSKTPAPWQTDQALNDLVKTSATVNLTTETNTVTGLTGPYYFSATPSEAMSFGGAGDFEV
jgi:hypothetical protein